MSAKYVIYEEEELQQNQLPSTSHNCKSNQVHIYQNYEPSMESSDEDNERIQISRCVPSSTNNRNICPTTPSINDDDEYGEDHFNVGYGQFFLRNQRQFTSIAGGLILLFPASLHVVWALTKFTWLEKEERTLEVFLIFASWYLGAIIGNLCGGLIVPIWPKRPIYTLGATLIVISSFFMLNDAKEMLIIGRIVAGISHGIVYITIIVHASENSVKEFREILMLLIAGCINCSYILAVIVFQPIDRIFLSESFLFIGSIVYAFIGLFLMLIYTIESVPFLVRHYCTETEAIKLLAKLQQKKITNQTVYQDYLIIRKMCDDELMVYGNLTFRHLFTKGNFRPIIFCCYGRIISILSLNLPIVTMILIFLRNCIEDMMPDTGIDTAALLNNNSNVVSSALSTPASKILIIVESTFVAALYNHEVQLVISVWCGFGACTTAVLYLFDRKRSIYYICCGLGSLLIISGVLHAFYNILSTVMHLCLIGYFNYTTFAIDLFGHGFLAEAFPTTMKPISIAYVMIIEHFLHIVLIFLYMATWFHDRIIVIMVVVTILSFEIGQKMPKTNDMSLVQAEKEYRKINIRFIDAIVDNYSLQML